MSTPNTVQHGGSKSTPRAAGAAFTPSASSPSRSVPSPAHPNAATTHAKSGKLPPKRPHSTNQTPMPLDSLTSTYLGGSSPPNPDTYSAGRPVGPEVPGYPRAGPPAIDLRTLHDGLGLGSVAQGASGGASQSDTGALAANAALQDQRAELVLFQKTKEIVDLIGTRWGYVSQENVERCAKRIGGLECVWVEEGGQARTLSIAASELVIDIEWMGEYVQKVTLSYAKPSTGETTVDELGSEMLRKDLAGWPDNGPGYVPLKHFAANLQRLATTDQLGGEKLSCFEALQGIHSSLTKLWDFEVEKQQGQAGFENKEDSEVEVLHQQSGKPSMHSTRSIGLRLEYWMEQRRRVEKDKKLHKIASPRTNLWSLEIGCQQLFDATQYQPVRISDAWISKDVMATVPVDDPMMSGPHAVIDWQEPAATLVPLPELNTGADAMDIDIVTGSTQPNIRFVAKLDPPVTLSSKVASALFSQLGQPLQDSIQWPTFPSLLFPAPGPKEVTPNHSRDTSRRFPRSIGTPDAKGDLIPTPLNLTVFTQRDTQAITLDELPFSHPKQLVEILPYLRQWALFGQILQRSAGVLPEQSLSSSEEKKAEKSMPNTRNGKKARPRRPATPPSDTDSDSDSDSQPKSPVVMKDGKPIDVTFSYDTLNSRIDLECSFPLSSGSLKQMRFSIFPNARMEVSSDDSSAKDDGMELDHVDKLAEKSLKVLRLSEDLCWLGAWILTQK